MNAWSFRIAGVEIRLESDRVLEVTEEFAPFLEEILAPRYRAVFHRVEELPSIPSEVTMEGCCHRIHPDGRGGHQRSFFDPPRDLEAYSLVTYDFASGSIDVPYLEKGSLCVSELSNCFYHLGLEEIMLREDRLCFHAACVSTEHGGLLFAGPSGIGKSTQAQLWCDHRNARLINGDRPILSLENGKIVAWGSPYAGSSRCYRNESCRVRAIVLLQQGTVCSIRKLERAEAARRVYAGMNVHTWDRSYAAKALDLTMDLVTQIPVYELSCTPDKDAVTILENVLKEGE